VCRGAHTGLLPPHIRRTGLSHRFNASNPINWVPGAAGSGIARSFDGGEQSLLARFAHLPAEQQDVADWQQ